MHLILFDCDINELEDYFQLACQMREGAGEVEAGGSCDSLREDTGEDGLAESAVTNSFL